VAYHLQIGWQHAKGANGMTTIKDALEGAPDRRECALNWALMALVVSVLAGLTSALIS
jgi:hypothetical protein